MLELTQFKAEFFKALAHPLRIKVLDVLRDAEFGVNELCSRLGAEQSHLSQQSVTQPVTDLGDIV